MSKIASLKKEVGSLQTKLAEKNKLLDDQNTQIKKLAAERDDARKNVESLRQEIVTLNATKKVSA